MNTRIFLLIVGMALVTYIPRALPALIMGKFKLPHWFEVFLKYLPFAAIGALICPGIFTIDSGKPICTLLTVIVAFALAVYKKNTALTILGSTAFYLVITSLF